MSTLDQASSPTCTYHVLTSSTFKSGAGQLVVVLSHDYGFLNLVRVLLDEFGYVAYADEAPPCKNELIARLQPALVIIDINYGHEPFTWALLRAVKEDPATASIPVITCAAAPWLLDHESVFFAHNSVCTWSEPYDPIELLRTIDVALSGTGGESLTATWARPIPGITDVPPSGPPMAPMSA